MAVALDQPNRQTPSPCPAGQAVSQSRHHGKAAKQNKGNRKRFPLNHCGCGGLGQSGFGFFNQLREGGFVEYGQVGQYFAVQLDGGAF